MYRTILADPPWPEHGAGKIKRGADKHYPLLTIREIKEFSHLIREWADPVGCHLYLWVTNNYLPAGLEVMEAWGFTYKTTISWGKVGRDGKPQTGLGQYFRGASEHILFGVRGNLSYKLREDGLRAQGRTLILEPRGEHSVKPESLVRMAELVSYPPRLELFARQRREGWDCRGNEV